MVKNVSSLTGNGVRNFLFQRLSALYLAVFIIGFVVYLVFHPVTDFYSWHALFEDKSVCIATAFFFLALSIHAWIGLWMIATDYLKDYVVRLSFMIAVMLILLGSLVWGLGMLWGR